MGFHVALAPASPCGRLPQLSAPFPLRPAMMLQLSWAQSHGALATGPEHVASLGSAVLAGHLGHIDEKLTGCRNRTADEGPPLAATEAEGHLTVAASQEQPKRAQQA